MQFGQNCTKLEGSCLKHQFTLALFCLRDVTHRLPWTCGSYSTGCIMTQLLSDRTSYLRYSKGVSLGLVEWLASLPFFFLPLWVSSPDRVHFTLHACKWLLSQATSLRAWVNKMWLPLPFLLIRIGLLELFWTYHWHQTDKAAILLV